MYSPVYLVGGPKFTGKDFKDMLDQAKADPDGLSLATAGVGSLGHLMLEQINGQAKVRITHVPYKGMAQMVPDALGGQFTLMLVNACWRWAHRPACPAGRTRRPLPNWAIPWRT
ncbi:hypothetical protein G6F22_021072 [Rhizopus arrhizus]|nr:hypothetical protein G6F22_021072 [Rhizopus arrhizus]